jgi:hypothetical protein
MLICKLLPVLLTLFNVQHKYLFFMGLKWPADKLTHFQRRGCVLLQITTDGNCHSFTTLTVNLLVFHLVNWLQFLLWEFRYDSNHTYCIFSNQKLRFFLFLPFFRYLSSALQASEIKKKVMQWNITWLITSTWRHTFCTFLSSCLIVTNQYHIHMLYYIGTGTDARICCFRLNRPSSY